jgi:hypothetical protein
MSINQSYEDTRPADKKDYSFFDERISFKIKINVQFIKDAIESMYNDNTDWLSAAQDHGLKWIMKYNIPEQDWIDYAKAIEDDYNNDIPSNPLDEDFLPFKQYFFDYHTGCREDIEPIMNTFDKLFHPKHHRHAANKIADWWINVKEQRRIRAANKISEWFLDCKYNPKYKYCQDRLWKQFQQIHIIEEELEEITDTKRRNECVCMGCPNESVVFQELDCPDNSITGDGKDWYCAKCYKECVDDEYEL